MCLHNRRKSIKTFFLAEPDRAGYRSVDKMKSEIAKGEKYRKKIKKDFATQQAKCLFICRNSHTVSVPSVCLAQITINLIYTDSSIWL